MRRSGIGGSGSILGIMALGAASCLTVDLASAAGDRPTPELHQGVPAAPTSFALRYRAFAGRTERQLDDVRLTGRTHGRTFTFDNTQVNRVRFIAAGPNGDVAFEDRVEVSTLRLNGRRQPDEPRSAPNVFRIHADGRLASYSDGSGEPIPTHLTERLFTATTPVFPSRAVSVGDRWSHDYAPSAAVGLPKAHADFAIVRRGKHGGADTVKVQMRYAEAGSGPRIAASGVIWVEIASGDPVDTECRLTGVPVEDDAEHGETTLFSGSLTQRRTEGGPLPSTPHNR